MQEILVVESDSPTLSALADELLADGHEVQTARVDAAARQRLAGAGGLILGRLGSVAETLVLLRDLRDGQIPGADPGMAVITIGADHDHELIRHYQAGSDIALPTAASPTLVNASVQSLSARAARTAQGPSALTVGDLKIDRAARTATVAGEPVALTNREFDVLATLAERPNEAVSTAQLYEQVWGSSSMRGRAADAQVSRVRQKLSAAGSVVEVQAVRGFGTRLLSGQPQPVRLPPNRPPSRGRGR